MLPVPSPVADTRTFLTEFRAELWHILLESGVWLIAGLAMAGLVHAFVARAWFERHLGGRGAWPVVKASLLGIPLPLCSCSVIPVAASLRRQGAGKGATAAFAISTPQTGEESIPITWALFGPVFALARPVIAVVTALIAGLLINATEREEAPEQVEEDAATTADPSRPPLALPVVEHRSLGARLREAARHGFGTMLVDLAPWLAAGILMAAAVGAAVPPGWIAEHVGTGLWPKVAMLFVGVPLYICATSSTPLAWSLVLAGLSPGAAIVLLLAGPATNLATMSWVIKDLGVRALVIYLAVIAAVALGAGTAFDAFFPDALVLAERAPPGGHTPGGVWEWTKAAGAAAIAGLLVWTLVMRFWPGGDKGSGGSCCSTAPAESKACCSSRA